MKRVVLLALLATACAPRTPARAPPEIVALAAGAPWTVIELFSATCPCQLAHDARLASIIRDYEPRGVRFVIVDPEAGRTQADDDVEARARGYPIAIRRDDGAVVARALRGRFATYTVVIDREGRIRYAGGIDSDHGEATATSRPYLRGR